MSILEIWDFLVRESGFCMLILGARQKKIKNFYLE